jgi:hypothetical protein
MDFSFKKLASKVVEGCAQVELRAAVKTQIQEKRRFRQ